MPSQRIHRSRTIPRPGHHGRAWQAGRSWLGALCCALALGAIGAPAHAQAPGFETALEAHLAAINRRDWPAYEATLSRAEHLSLVLPNGRYSSTGAAFRKSMQTWLADADWRWSYRLLSRHSHEQTGVALLEVDYWDKDEAGQEYRLRYLLGLVFSQHADGWKLVHDQNTLLPPP